MRSPMMSPPMMSCPVTNNWTNVIVDIELYFASIYAEKNDLMCELESANSASSAT